MGCLCCMAGTCVWCLVCSITSNWRNFKANFTKRMTCNHLTHVKFCYQSKMGYKLMIDPKKAICTLVMLMKIPQNSTVSSWCLPWCSADSHVIDDQRSASHIDLSWWYSAIDDKPTTGWRLLGSSPSNTDDWLMTAYLLACPTNRRPNVDSKLDGYWWMPTTHPQPIDDRHQAINNHE